MTIAPENPHLDGYLAGVSAERERCAIVAEKFAEANARFNDGDEAPACAAMGLAIAAQIRDPKSPPF